MPLNDFGQLTPPLLRRGGHSDHFTNSIIRLQNIYVLLLFRYYAFSAIHAADVFATAVTIQYKYSIILCTIYTAWECRHV